MRPMLPPGWEWKDNVASGMGQRIDKGSNELTAREAWETWCRVAGLKREDYNYMCDGAELLHHLEERNIISLELTSGEWVAESSYGEQSDSFESSLEAVRSVAENRVDLDMIIEAFKAMEKGEWYVMPGGPPGEWEAVEVKSGEIFVSEANGPLDALIKAWRKTK